MKYIRRLVWFIASRLLIFTICVSVLLCAFYMCMNTANVYIVLNDGLACLGYLHQGQPGRGLRGLVDLLNPRVKDGVFSCDDPRPFFRYLKNTLGKGGD